MENRLVDSQKTREGITKGWRKDNKMGSDLDIYFHGSESGCFTPKQVVVLTVAGVSIATVGGTCG
jgi:hypothetical protein